MNFYGENWKTPIELFSGWKSINWGNWSEFDKNEWSRIVRAYNPYGHLNMQSTLKYLNEFLAGRIKENLTYVEDN